MASPCDRVRLDLNAYVDQTLPSRREELIAYHLAGCERCCAEMNALCEVRDTLSSCRRSATPMTLNARLEQIAGEHADAPLYLRAGPGRLPTSRVTRNRRLAQSGAALFTLAVALIVLAVLVAPEPTRITDPVKEARERYSMASSAVSVNEAVGAVLLAYEKGADLGATVSYQPRGFDGASSPISATAAAELLQESKNVDVAYSGSQRVWVAVGEGLYRSADVRTAKEPDRGAVLRVLDSRGSDFSAAFLPDFVMSAYSAPSGWSFSKSDDNAVIDGRAAVHLSAHADGRTVASWWLDTESGLLLWAERYDTSGQASIAVGYTSLSFGSADVAGDHTETLTLQPASSSGKAGWCVGMTTCPEALQGLPLVGYSSSDDGGSMVLVYSDGFQTAVLGVTPGVLDSGETSVRELSSSLPSVSVWQHGDTVLSLATNASSDVLAGLVAELPGESPRVDSVMDRIQAGLRRLIPA